MTTTIFPRPNEPPVLPDLKLRTADTTSLQKPQRPGGATTANTTSNQSPTASTAGSQYRVLAQDEWVQFCRGVGVMKDEESVFIVRPTSWSWPPKGFPDGLYRDVLLGKSKFAYWFHLLSTLRWTLMILQLAFNAILTALGSVSIKVGASITALAAINTLFSGLLALMHNSGLPERYRSDRNEFSKVEEHLKEILDTRLVPANDSIVEVMASCFDKFANARQSVQNNVPASYVSVSSTTPSKTVAAHPISTDKQ